jgi:hypothetical protein
MGRKRHTPEQMIVKLQGTEVELATGQTAASRARVDQARTDMGISSSLRSKLPTDTVNIRWTVGQQDGRNPQNFGLFSVCLFTIANERYSSSIDMFSLRR